VISKICSQLLILALAAACSATTPDTLASPAGSADKSMNDSTIAASAPLGGQKGAADKSAGGKVFPYAVESHQLDNGLKVLFVPMPSEGLVSYWSIVRTGSRDEVEKGVTGFAHFFEHMMFHGSKRFPGPVYDGIVNGMGADANAFTTDDFTAYHLGITQADLPKVIEIEADRFQHLEYDEPGFKTESGAVYGEYRKGRTSPFEVLFESVQNAAFDVHTYKHTTIGFEADIRRMPEQYAYSKTFFERFYRPENVVVVVTGDFDKRATLELIQKNYASWKAGYTAPKIVAEPEQTAERRIDVPFDGQTLPIVAINFKGERLSPGDRTMIAATLIGELAFGETSAAYKELVLDDQRVDAMFASFGYNRDPGLWSVIAKVKEPSDVSSVERRLWSAIDELAEKPVAAERLDSARSRLKYSFLSNLSTPGNVNESVAQIIAITGDIAAVDQIYNTLDQVTPADVQRAAAKYLTHKRATVAILHSKSEALAAAKVGAEPPVLMPVPADPNVAFNITFHVGSQNDPEGKEGLAALVGALISEGGTQKNTYSEVLEKLFPLAGGYSANVDKELTVVTGLVHRDKLAAFYDLFTQAIVTPGFRADDFERLRDNAVSDIETSLRFSSDEELGKAALSSDVFAGTPYAHLTDGSVESLKSITLEDVKNFWTTHFTRENLVIGLAGAYPDSLPASLQADLARLPSGVVENPGAPQVRAIQGRKVTIVEKPSADSKPGEAAKTTSAAISFGYPIQVKRGTREYYALWIANSWLGEHRNSSSHLYQVIREARGMNYGDYSYIEAYPNGGQRTMPPTGVGRRGQMFEVWIRPVPRDQAVFALRAALREVDLLSKNGMTKEQFDATKSFLSKYSLHFAETTGERLGYALDDRYFGVKEGHLALFRKMMKEITLEEVNAAVKKYLQVENVSIAIVSDHASELRDAIASDKPSPMSYGDIQKPKEVLEQDKQIESYPLHIPAEGISIVPVVEMFSGQAKIHG
jgi:zinc protease